MLSNLLRLSAVLSSCFIVSWIFSHQRYLFYRGPSKVEGGTVTLDDLERARARTGDLLLFSGRGRDSSVVNAWSGRRWTHVGMVVRDSDTGQLYIYHSDACPHRRNASDGKYKSGVQLNDLRLYLETYPGSAFHRPLYGETYTSASIVPLIRAFHGIVFNQNWVELLRCTQGRGGGIFGSKEERVDALFCSQFVAHLYYHMGIIGDDVPFNEYHPASFAGELDVDWSDGHGAGELSRIVGARQCDRI